MDELVTGDAVVLGLRPARLPTRVLASAIDMVAVGATYLLVTLVIVLAAGSLDDAAVAALSVATFLLVLVGGPIAVETLSHGRSLGKAVCGLRVVRDDGGPIRFRHALVRGAVGVVEILVSFGVVACVASLVSARGRRIGDVFAGTLVVRERPAAPAATAAPPPPPWLTGRFTALDLSGVPDGLWLAIRQFLTRMGQLDPAVGWSMAVRLADDLTARTGVPAPAGVPPAAYLAAVLHERQTRDAQRAFGGVYAGPAGSPPRGSRAAGGSSPGTLPSATDPFATAGGTWRHPDADAPFASSAAPVAPTAGRATASPASADGEPAAPRVADGRRESSPPGPEVARRPRTGFVPPA